MHRFVLHTPGSAPEKSRPVLTQIKHDLGYIPNLYAGMADAPAVLDSYVNLDQTFRATSLTPLQRGILLLTASRANECEYCIAAHSAELTEAGFPADEIDKVRKQRPLSDGKLEALRTFTHRVVENRGHVHERDIDRFLEAGFKRPQVLEVVLGVSMKTLSNYVNHVMDTPVDEQFSDFSWTESAAHADRKTAAATA